MVPPHWVMLRRTAPKHAPKLLGVLYIYCLKSACYKTGRVISHHPPFSNELYQKYETTTDKLLVADFCMLESD